MAMAGEASAPAGGTYTLRITYDVNPAVRSQDIVIDAGRLT